MQRAVRDRLNGLQRQMAASGYAEHSPEEVQQADADRCSKAQAELASFAALEQEMQTLLRTQ